MRPTLRALRVVSRKRSRGGLPRCTPHDGGWACCCRCWTESRRAQTGEALKRQVLSGAGVVPSLLLLRGGSGSERFARGRSFSASTATYGNNSAALLQQGQGESGFTTGKRQQAPRAALVNGRAMAAEILQEVRQEVSLMKRQGGITPGLAVLLVGDRQDSLKYVSMKDAVATSAGLASLSAHLPASSTHEDVLNVINGFNQDDRCHGILLQLPVPAHLDPRALLSAIKIEKDVECFHPMNYGRLSAWRRTVISPCTPRGVMEMLKRLKVKVKGMHAVVMGESSVVGLPMALMLNAARATVTMVHAETVDPQSVVRQADLVITAVGKQELVKRDWVKPGAVVIDVGINFVKDSTRPEGFRIVGDVDPGVRDVASIVSPVPGGVGPMTVAMLMRNCVDLALLRDKWAEVSDWVHPESSMEHSRRLQGAMLDFAMCQGTDEGSGRGPAAVPTRERPSPGEASGGDRQEAEVIGAMERIGKSIDEAELLTIINDSEKNAYNRLSFLEMSTTHGRMSDPHERSSTLCPSAASSPTNGQGGGSQGEARGGWDEEQRLHMLDSFRREAYGDLGGVGRGELKGALPPLATCAPATSATATAAGAESYLQDELSQAADAPEWWEGEQTQKDKPQRRPS